MTTSGTPAEVCLSPLLYSVSEGEPVAVLDELHHRPPPRHRPSRPIDLQQPPYARPWTQCTVHEPPIRFKPLEAVPTLSPLPFRLPHIPLATPSLKHELFRALARWSWRSSSSWLPPALRAAPTTIPLQLCTSVLYSSSSLLTCPSFPQGRRSCHRRLRPPSEDLDVPACSEPVS